MKPAKEGICDACGAQLTHRADDNKESFAKRMEIFHKSTTPLIDYYKSKGLLVSIDGNGGSADIITALTGILF
jgi:adenylate kinase